MIRKLVLIIVVSLFMVSPVFASKAVTPVRSATDDSIVFATHSTNVVYTKSMKVSGIENISVMYKAESYSDTVDLRLDAMQSYAPPTTEGTVDVKFRGTHALDTSITDERWYIATMDTVSMPYLLFKITGQGSNAADVMFQMKVIR